MKGTVPIRRTTIAITAAIGTALLISAPQTGRAAVGDRSVAAAESDLMTTREREKLDLSRYRVTDPNASYFDVRKRGEFLRQTNNPLLRAQVERLLMGMSCRQAHQLPILDDPVELPSFARENDEWRNAAAPYFAFEETMSKLAGHYVVTGDRYYADCIVGVLVRWARADAFLHIPESGGTVPQAWFAIEASLFASGLAFSIVHEYAEREHPDDTEAIERWLSKASRSHVNELPGPESCCNNHFYRRALHATAIGIVAEDDELFRYGVSAVYSALTEANPDGSLPREMARGTLAMHYQNYALLYLVTVMNMIERQGYDIFDLRIEGTSIHDVIDFALAAINDPRTMRSQVQEHQENWFLRDNQYVSWVEVYLSRFDHAGLEKFVSPYRPVFNRSAGGYVTLYFYSPEEDWVNSRLRLIRGDYATSLKSCRKHPRWTEERDVRWRLECERNQQIISRD